MRKYSRHQLGFIGKQKVRLDAYHQGTAQNFFMSNVGSYGDHEDVGYYMQASVEEAARKINEAAGATVTTSVCKLMTAEFAPTAGITKVLVAGVASSRKVQAINTAYGLAVDKTVMTWKMSGQLAR
ncbi:hypothetical protein D6D11_02736 [Aureobasidium pullulans]|nr:hypothetical protein D6D11_02736 [Aureobasidium pullulans]